MKDESEAKPHPSRGISDWNDHMLLLSTDLNLSSMVIINPQFGSVDH